MATDLSRRGQRRPARDDLCRRDWMVAAVCRDVAAQQVIEASLDLRNRLLDAVNRVLQTIVTCDSEREVADTFLAVAEDHTGSTMGFVTRTERARYARQPPGEPAGPFRRHERVCGLVCLANKAGGYRSDDGHVVEQLAGAFVEAYDRKRERRVARERDARQRLLFESDSDVVVLYGAALTVLDVSPSVNRPRGDRFASAWSPRALAIPFVRPDRRGDERLRRGMVPTWRERVAPGAYSLSSVTTSQTEDLVGSGVQYPSRSRTSSTAGEENS